MSHWQWGWKDDKYILKRNVSNIKVSNFYQLTMWSDPKQNSNETGQDGFNT